MESIVDTVHLAAAAAWLVGLAALAIATVRADPFDARGVVERFSPLSFGALAVVVLTGTFQSVREVTTLDALETSYGRLLAVKVALVLAVIGIASVTRSALRGRLALEGDEPLSEPQTMQAVRRLVVAELLVALVVIGVTVLLVDADPSAASATAAFDETVVVDDALVNVVVPASDGPIDIHLYVDDPASGLTAPLDATGTMSSGETTGMIVELVDAGPGHWSAYDIDVPSAGQWELTVDIQLADDHRISAAFTIPIGGSQ